jgi:DNA replication protein DnaC
MSTADQVNPDDDDRGENALEAARDRARQAAAAWSEKIPPRLRGQYEMRGDVARWAQRLALGTAGNLWLYGLPGAGKTWHALHAISAAYRHGYTGTAGYADPQAWRTAVQPGGGSRLVDTWSRCGALVLDDLGALRLGEWDLENLFLIVNHRWAVELPTLVVSNTPNLRDMLGDRIAGRLRDGITAVDFGDKDTGTDHRRPAPRNGDGGAA